jgi:hypothetical protein
MLLIVAGFMFLGKQFNAYVKYPRCEKVQGVLKAWHEPIE